MSKTKYNLSEQSDLLSDFYKQIHLFINKKKREHKIPFEKCYGLCTNLAIYTRYLGIDRNSLHNAKGDMEAQFVEAGLNPEYPFNAGHQPSYYEESESYSMFKNPARRAWVRDHVKK